jgi:succinate-acetate transporter protein
LSVSEDRTVQPAPATAAPASGIADPGPLGLAAFALTTFLLSANNAHWMTHATGASFLAFAYFYGGVAQLLAGMWEIRNRNVFGGLLFGSFGAFWIGLAVWFRFQAIPLLVAATGPVAHTAAAALVNHDLGWILLAWAIFTTYMLIMGAQANTITAVALFLLWATLIILAIGNFTLAGQAATSGIIQLGGYVGLATAAAAWYASAAGLAAGMAGRIRLPLGPPLIK